MSVRLFLQIGERQAILLEYFFTLCEVPAAKDSYWSSKRGHGAATHLQIIQPIANKHPLFC